MKKQTDICTGVVGILASLNTAFNIYLIFYTHKQDITLYPVKIDDEQYLVIKIINLFTSIPNVNINKNSFQIY